MKVGHAETQSSDAASFVLEAANLLMDRHCQDVLVLDVIGLSQVCDYVLIGSGTSDRQMKSVSNELGDLQKDAGFPAFRTNIDTGATWIVVDFISVVVHVFEPRQREYYDLEDLWSDARRIDVTTGTSAS